MARKIVERRVGALPIVDAAGVLVEILSFVDVLERLAEDAEQDGRAIALGDHD